MKDTECFQLKSLARSKALERFELPDDTSDNELVKRMIDDPDFTSEVAKQIRQQELLAKGKNMSVSEKDLMGNSIRVKPESSKYKTEKSLATHRKFGIQLYDDKGEEARNPSELEKAKFGVYAKYLSRKSTGVVLNEHERGLLNEVFADDAWAGDFNAEYHKHIAPGVITKAVLDDTLSGGSYTSPFWLDEMAVTTPLLSGQLSPFVTIREVPRGSQVQTPDIGNVTSVWGVPSGTAAPIFDTDDLINNLTHNIFPLQSTLECGLDLLRDSALNLGNLLVEEMTKSAAAQLDKVIAVGDGVTQPEGIATASGLSTANSVNNTTGPTTLTDLERLIFGVGLAHRQAPGSSFAFILNDTTYRRFKTSKVDPSTPGTEVDQRYVQGMNLQDYRLLENPARISNHLSNSVGFYCDLKKYRLLRRLGVSLTVVQDTDFQLVRENKVGFVMRSRWGGGVFQPAAFCKMADLQS